MSKLKNAIIFDGDDTLWPTQIYYNQAKEQFYELMEHQSLKRRDVESIFTEIDLANVARLSFSKSRFPKSMVDTYEYFCKDFTLPIDPKVREKVSKIGNSIYNRKPILASGAKEVLESLKQAYSLYLYTAGDPMVQRDTIRTLEMAKYFEAIYIRERKSESELQYILDEQRLDAERTWMIGNSPRSDINPALKLGLRSIWICQGCWEYDQETLLSGRIWQVSTLTEIIPLLGQIDSFKLD